jgi:hypothetical protein
MKRNKYSQTKLPVAVIRAIPVSVLVLTMPVFAANSPVTSVDSRDFTLNTTASTESGTQRESDSSVDFVLNTTGTLARQSDSADFAVDTRGPVLAFSLSNPLRLSNGKFQFGFTNLPGTGFLVYGATNLTTPFSNWTFMGTVTDSPPGQYSFVDPQATNYSRRFYRVASP